MIDVKNIKQKFEEYVSKYNPENERISLKIEHIKNVAKNCEMLAKKLIPTTFLYSLTLVYKPFSIDKLLGRKKQ